MSREDAAQILRKMLPKMYMSKRFSLRLNRDWVLSLCEKTNAIHMQENVGYTFMS